MLKLLFVGLLGAVIIIVSYQLLGWQMGYLALILCSLWFVLTIPPKLKRWLLLLHSVFTITLLSSTFLHTMWMRSASVQRALKQIGILHRLAGSDRLLIAWAILIGLLIGTTVVLLALLATLYVSSEFVLNLASSLKTTRAKAMKYLFDLLLQINLPLVFVNEGQSQVIGQIEDENGRRVSSGQGRMDRLGGPAWLIVKPGNAAVVEQLEGVRKIAGPGFATIERFDKVKAVDLRPQEEMVTIHGVLTKDRVPLTFQVNISFQIEPRADTDSRPEALTERRHVEGVIDGIYPVYKESVFKAVYDVSKEGWQKETTRALESALRAAVFEYNLDELYDYSVTTLAQSQRTVPLQMTTQQVSGQQKGSPLVISALKEKVKTSLAAAALAWGVKVNSVDIAKVEMPAAIHEMVLTWWKKKWETEIAKQDAEKEAMVAEMRASSQLLSLSSELEGAARAQEERLDRMLRVLRGADPKTVELLLHLVTRRPQYVDGRVIEILSGRGPELLMEGQAPVEGTVEQKTREEGPPAGPGEAPQQPSPAEPLADQAAQKEA